MKLSLLTFLLLCLAMPSSAQSPDIVYHLRWGAPNAHYFDVTMEIGTTADVEVRIPAWRPGRYIMQNYAQNVIDFSATDGEGNPLASYKVDKNTWHVVRGMASEAVVKYKSYVHQLDAGASYLDATEAYLNPITSLMYVLGREMEPVALVIHKPDDWRVATPLDYDENVEGYPAPNYHELVDSPFLISPDFKLLSFEVEGATIQIAIQGDLPVNDDALISDHRRIVKTAFDLMDNIPFTRYLFMYHILPYRFGHGVEHKNATSIVLGPGDKLERPADPATTWTPYSSLLGVASHEFFHTWNVERIRPEAIYYPDYATENYTSQMWIFEGITDYFSDVILMRAGLESEGAFLRDLSRTIARFDTNPARHITSIAMSSYDSWAKQVQAPPHTFFSFYTAGKIMGLLLDLEVRDRTKGAKSLDDVMRYLDVKYAQKDRGVPEDGFQRALEAVTGTSFQAFFDAYIYGKEEIDYNRFLGHAGMTLLKKTDPAKPAASMGLSLDNQNKVRDVMPGSAAFRAGLDLDDVILSVAGKDPSDGRIDEALRSHQAGDDVEVKFSRWGKEMTVTVTLGARAPDLYSIEPLPDATEAQTRLRAAWLRPSE